PARRTGRIAVRGTTGSGRRRLFRALAGRIHLGFVLALPGLTGALGAVAARAAPAALAACAIPAAAATLAAAATGTATTAARILGGALLARLAEDLAHALTLGGVGLPALTRLARQRLEQLGRHRLGGDLLLDEGLDVRQAHGVALAGKADRVAFLAPARGAADAVHVVLGIERKVVVEDELHAVDVQAAGGYVGRHQDLELAGLEPL